MSNTPTPDTSNANVARVLRSVTDELDLNICVTLPCIAEARALADALDAQPAVTWSEEAYDLALDAFRVDGSFRDGVRAYLSALNMTPPAHAVTWAERVEAAGLRMMPTAWPAMTPKERRVYIDRWEPIARAFFPELAPPTED